MAFKHIHSFAPLPVKKRSKTTLTDHIIAEKPKLGPRGFLKIPQSPITVLPKAVDSDSISNLIFLSNPKYRKTHIRPTILSFRVRSYLASTWRDRDRQMPRRFFTPWVLFGKANASRIDWPTLSIGPGPSKAFSSPWETRSTGPESPRAPL